MYYNYRCRYDSEEDRKCGNSCRTCGIHIPMGTGTMICPIQDGYENPGCYTSHVQLCDAWVPKKIDVMKYLLEENIKLKRTIEEQNQRI